MGDAASATREKGERWLESGARGYAEAIARVFREGGTDPD
jgi:creatinine amidohydrolase/Fe(II)-dependent formamide hydrolase-like protein